MVTRTRERLQVAEVAKKAGEVWGEMTPEAKKPSAAGSGGRPGGRKNVSNSADFLKKKMPAHY